MVNEYQITINSTDDISRMLAEAERLGIAYDYYNACIYLRGASGTSIDVGEALKGLYVVAEGAAIVHVREGASVIAEGSATVHVHDDSSTVARSRATVYAHDSALVTLEDQSSAYVTSDDVEVLAQDDSTVYLPAERSAGADPIVELRDSAEVIRTSVPPN